MTDDQIKHMVDRFLGWRLPEHFRPDAGISFNPEYNVEYNAARGKPPARHQPSGTNLFGATQAEAMVRYMVEGMTPAATAQAREVMPIIGPLLDAWQGLSNDVQDLDELTEVAGYMDALEQAMDADPTPFDGEGKHDV